MDFGATPLPFSLLRVKDQQAIPNRYRMSDEKVLKCFFRRSMLLARPLMPLSRWMRQGGKMVA